LRPRVDATLEIVELAKSFVPKILSGLLTPNAVMTLEDHRCAPIQLEQPIVMWLVEKVRSVDACERALPLRADIDQFEGRAAIDQRLQIVRGQLAHERHR